MKRWLKILLRVFGLLLLAGAGFFLFVLFRPNPPATIIDPAPSGRRIESEGLFGNYYPATTGQGRRPAILLLGGSEGGLGRETAWQAMLLQQAGFSVLHLGYFNVPGTGSKLERVPLERFARGLDWLRAQPEVDPAAIGIVGHSKGAEAALLVGTHDPGVRAIVAAAPSSVAWDSLAAWSYILPGGASSWTRDGADVPSLAYGRGGGETLLSVFTTALDHLGEHPDTIIPVENYQGRLLLVCGEQDNLWPACPMARDIAARAVRAGRPAPELIAYPDAGHGIIGFPLREDHPMMQYWGRVGGTPQSNAAARADGWPRILTFLRRNLAGPDAR